ncbi:hypothetical protein [uncultured Mucilaginibacter sp.]|uniref:hypothetical protein n=1 Tax=uncultured Mucilaginibacter sp. TaxID=797541 RepID=UPI0025E9766F|nr:hypothetical protein [uncultured Mucilaginibacter sp.]
MKKDYSEGMDFLFLHGVVNERANIIGKGKYNDTVVDFDSNVKFWGEIWAELTEISDQIKCLNIDTVECIKTYKNLLKYMQSIFMYFIDSNKFVYKNSGNSVILNCLIPNVKPYYQSVDRDCRNVLDIIKTCTNFSSTEKKELATVLSAYIDFFEMEIHLSELSNQKPIVKPPPQPINCLEDAIINDAAKENIFRILISNELIDKDTKFFTDKKSGKKGAFYSSIILFAEKGYFKRIPVVHEYLNICNNTFRANISKATANNHKTRAASTLNIPSFT